MFYVAAVFVKANFTKLPCVYITDVFQVYDLRLDTASHV